jgi:hypothetical protein
MKVEFVTNFLSERSMRNESKTGGASYIMKKLMIKNFFILKMSYKRQMD